MSGCSGLLKGHYPPELLRSFKPKFLEFVNPNGSQLLPRHEKTLSRLKISWADGAVLDYYPSTLKKSSNISKFLFLRQNLRLQFFSLRPLYQTPIPSWTPL